MTFVSFYATDAAYTAIQYAPCVTSRSIHRKRTPLCYSMARGDIQIPVPLLLRFHQPLNCQHPCRHRRPAEPRFRSRLSACPDAKPTSQRATIGRTSSSSSSTPPFNNSHSIGLDTYSITARCTISGRDAHKTPDNCSSETIHRRSAASIPRPPRPPVHTEKAIRAP